MYAIAMAHPDKGLMIACKTWATTCGAFGWEWVQAARATGYGAALKDDTIGRECVLRHSLESVYSFIYMNVEADDGSFPLSVYESNGYGWTLPDNPFHEAELSRIIRKTS